MSERAPFLNAWLFFTCCLLLLIYGTTGVAAVMDGDMTTIAAIIGVTVFVFGVRAYQYFVQGR